MALEKTMQVLILLMMKVEMIFIPFRNDYDASWILNEDTLYIRSSNRPTRRKNYVGMKVIVNLWDKIT